VAVAETAVDVEEAMKVRDELRAKERLPPRFLHELRPSVTLP